MYLKPCPFCGGEPHLGPDSSVAFVVQCKTCGAKAKRFALPGYSSKTFVIKRLKFKASEAWNRRVTDAEQ